jgi:hypothetical protein
VSPELYCEEHWLAWWNEDLDPEDHFSLEPEGCPIKLRRLNNHVRSCNLCCSEDNNFDYCAIGDSLEETWAETIPED